MRSKKLSFIALSWTIVHPINEESPLRNLVENDVEELEAEFMISIKAIDDTYSQQIFDRNSYFWKEMKYIQNNRVLITIICFLFYNNIWSQLVNVESQRIQSDSIRFVLNADLSYTNQKNNDEKLSIFTSSIASQIKSKSLKDIFLVLFNVDYSEANNASASIFSLF